MKQGYFDILEKYNIVPFNKAAKYCMELFKEPSTIQQTFSDVSSMVTAPVLVSYVWWVLTEAERRGLKRLYFLARDGYVMHQIAIRFCKRFDIDIDCRYLYCSRASLRLPTYHFIGDEAYKLLLIGGYSLTPKHILQRIKLSEDERQQIFIETGTTDKDKVLTKPEFQDFTEKLRVNETYIQAVKRESIEAYHSTIGYLRQEGLLDGEHVAIVDTGWTGSMQRSLRQLISREVNLSGITGFYFGMFTEPKSSEDGEYLTWYFSSKTSKSVLIKFNNNLLECLCSAPHGMTLGYDYSNGKYVPILKSDSVSDSINKVLANKQVNIVCTFTDILLEHISFRDFNKRVVYSLSKQLLQKLMFSPSKEVALAFGEYTFCDDISETYQYKLAEPGQDDQLYSYLFINRIYRKFISNKKGSKYKGELFWPYGSLALSNLKPKFWYRVNMYLWELIRYKLT